LRRRGSDQQYDRLNKKMEQQRRKHEVSVGGCRVMHVWRCQYIHSSCSNIFVAAMVQATLAGVLSSFHMNS